MSGSEAYMPTATAAGGKSCLNLYVNSDKMSAYLTVKPHNDGYIVNESDIM
jgi:hypothetical protein